MSQLGGYGRNVRDLLAAFAASDPSSADTFFRRNMPRVGQYDDAGHTAHVALTTAVMTSGPILLFAGDTVTNISVRSGATAAGTPTNQWAALYSTAATPALMAQSTDRTTEAWAANTTRTFVLTTAQTIRETGYYWWAVMVTATTVPTLLGCVVAPSIVTGERSLSQSSGSGLAGTAPATIATPTAKQFCPYVVIT